MHLSVHSSTVHSNQDMKATSVSTDRLMVIENIGYTYNGIIFSLKKEGNPDTSYNIVDDIMLSGIN